MPKHWAVGCRRDTVLSPQAPLMEQLDTRRHMKHIEPGVWKKRRLRERGEGTQEHGVWTLQPPAVRAGLGRIRGLKQGFGAGM